MPKLAEANANSLAWGANACDVTDMSLGSFTNKPREDSTHRGKRQQQLRLTEGGPGGLQEQRAEEAKESEEQQRSHDASGRTGATTTSCRSRRLFSSTRAQPPPTEGHLPPSGGQPPPTGTHPPHPERPHGWVRVTCCDHVLWLYFCNYSKIPHLFPGSWSWWKLVSWQLKTGVDIFPKYSYTAIKYGFSSYKTEHLLNLSWCFPAGTREHHLWTGAGDSKHQSADHRGHIESEVGDSDSLRLRLFDQQVAPAHQTVVFEISFAFSAMRSNKSRLWISSN